jgi:hypothetical protein
VDNENFLNEEGELQTVRIDEIRFALLKLELKDSKFLNYTTDSNGKRIVQIIIEDDAGLPDLDQKLKKACFINNPNSNKLNYEMRVVDRESPGVAHFFTQKILNCKYVIRHKYYIIKLKSTTLNFVKSMREEGIINEQQELEITKRFDGIIKLDNVIKQNELGNILFEGYIENDEDLTGYNDSLLNKYHSAGLTYNNFKIEQADLEYIQNKQYIYFGKESYIRFTDKDKKENIIKIDDENKVITIHFENQPSKLARYERKK